MNLKRFCGIVGLLFFVFSFQSCSSDFETIEGDDKLEIGTPIIAVAKPLYCRYNVTSSTVPNMEAGDMVCFDCTSPCLDSITNKRYKITVEGSMGQDSIITVGFVSGTGVSSSGACKACPTGGHVSS